MITHEELLSMFRYQRSTGQFIRLTAQGGQPAGSTAGTVDKDGYVIISVRKKMYRRGRLAWFYAHGEWPRGEIDHKNTIRSDDRLRNLREGTHQFNRENTRKPYRSVGRTSRFLGVSWSEKRGCWMAFIKVGKKNKNLGGFSSEAAASRAYKKAKRIGHAGCTI